MASKDFFKHMAVMGEAQTRVIETLGVPYSDPFNEEATISDVNDPKKLGRVKVTTRDDLVSDWIPVAGSSRGVLSARFLGAKVLVGKVNGRSEDMYVIGVVRNDPEIGLSGTPIQLPIIDESMAVWGGSKDEGLQCNGGNEGRVYILSNEMNQDVVVCLRRTNLQTGSKTSWAWKSLSNGLWVEKGVNPGNVTSPEVEQAQERNPGIPECSESMLGEIHEFAEDRGFRTTTMVCRRSEDKTYSWMPISSPPTFFRTTLPKCSDKIHGFEAILDDGNNSELLICQRYQGKMDWVRHAARVPHKFHKPDKPLSRVEFLNSLKPIPALGEQEVGDWWTGEGVKEAMFDELIKNIPLTGTDPDIRDLLRAASLIPSTAFDGADVLSKVARAGISKKTGVPIDEIVSVISNEFIPNNGDVSPASQELISTVGTAFDTLLNGVKDGDVEGALKSVGEEGLSRIFTALNPQVGSVMTGLISGGIVGAVDTAISLGLDKLPPEVNKYVSPVVGVASQILASKYPSSVSNLLNAAVNGGLSNKVSSLINVAAKRNIVTPQLLEGLTKGLKNGSFGPVSQAFNAVSNLEIIPKIDINGIGAIPRLATTVLGVVGQSNALLTALGSGGVGIDGFNQLLKGGGISATLSLLSGFKGIANLFNGGGLECPCDPKCRKTKHGEDSDGNSLLEKCGSLTANNANAYSPTGDPIKVNVGPVARALGLSPTGLGQSLIPVGLNALRDPVNALKNVARLKELGNKYFSSFNSDPLNAALETAYSFEAVQKSLQIGANYTLRTTVLNALGLATNTNFMRMISGGPGAKKSVAPETLKYVEQNSRAIRDLYAYVRKLDLKKNGPSAGVRVTPSLAKSFRVIADSQKLRKYNNSAISTIFASGVLPALDALNSLNPPGGKLSLGSYIDVPDDPFPNLTTDFDEARIVKEVLSARLTDYETVEDTPYTALSDEQLAKLSVSPGGESPSVLDTVANREGDCSCEETTT